MKAKKQIIQSGFTLIEIIAVTVIVSVFSAIMLTMISESQYGSLIKSSDPLRGVLKSSGLSKIMAYINADYAPYPRWKASTSYSAANPKNKILPTGSNGRFYICKTGGTSGTSEPQWLDYGETQDGNVKWKPGLWEKNTAYSVGDMIIPTNPNGHFYRCMSAGLSGSAEPLWPLTGQASVNDGSAQWMRLLGYLNLQIGAANSTQDNNYGQYDVVDNRFVKFVSKAMQPISIGDSENVLEVKIKNDKGETLMALFTAKEN
jgi:prepilin-type N-terminal cleavage/methylation domain-containing protein